VRTDELSAGTRLDNQDCWDPRVLWSWAAVHAPQRAAAMPLGYWPSSTRPARYEGALQVRHGVVQSWSVQGVPLRLLWPLPGRGDPDVDEALAAGKSVPQVLRVGPAIGIYGPELFAAFADSPQDDRSHDSDGGVSSNWNDLAHVLGPARQAPFWPYELRSAELLMAWRPVGQADIETAVETAVDGDVGSSGGGGPEVVLAVSEPDTAPVLRLAATLEEGTPAARTLVNLAQTIQYRATSSARVPLRIFAREERYRGVQVAAVPLDCPEVDTDDLDESVRRAGWLEILARSDRLAIEVVGLTLMWDNGTTLPFSKLADVNPATALGREWSRRLVPAERYTAAFEIPIRGSREQPAALLVDPETDAPVVRYSDGTLVAAVPQRLPATSPLAEVILDRPIWIRDEDGVLHLAPEHHYFGINWGYGGSGPGSLALLLDRLLDDINAPAADSVNGAPDALEEFTQHAWPHGTVFTRDQLADIRDGRPYPKPASSPGSDDDPE